MPFPLLFLLSFSSLAAVGEPGRHCAHLAQPRVLLPLPDLPLPKGRDARCEHVRLFGVHAAEFARAAGDDSGQRQGAGGRGHRLRMHPVLRRKADPKARHDGPLNTTTTLDCNLFHKSLKEFFFWITNGYKE